jgi:hypothetical protein
MFRRESWAQLTRSAVPDMVVARRPLECGDGGVLPVGAAVPSSVTELRLRQLYEQRRIDPVVKQEKKPAVKINAPLALKGKS